MMNVPLAGAAMRCSSLKVIGLPVLSVTDRYATSTMDSLYRWFGPRGLADDRCAILGSDEKLPGKDTIMLRAGLDSPAQCHRPWRSPRKHAGEEDGGHIAELGA